MPLGVASITLVVGVAVLVTGMVRDAHGLPSRALVTAGIMVGLVGWVFMDMLS